MIKYNPRKIWFELLQVKHWNVVPYREVLVHWSSDKISQRSVLKAVVTRYVV